MGDFDISRIHLPNSDEADRLKLISECYAPQIGPAARAYSLAVYQHSSLSLREMEAARYRTAQINGCKVCQLFRGATDAAVYLANNGGRPAESAATRGEPPNEAFYVAVGDWAASSLYSERERIAVELAERMGERPHSMEGDEAFWARIHAAYTDREIVDLTLSIASWIALGRIAHTLELDDVCIPGFAASRSPSQPLEPINE